MRELLKRIENKVKTREDLTDYLQTIAEAREELHGDGEADLSGSFGMIREEKEKLERELKKMKNERKELIKKEEELIERKMEIRSDLMQEKDSERREKLQRERKTLEEERREKENRIWDLEEEISDKEEALKKFGFSPDSDNSFHEFLDRLEERLRSKPVLKMELAVYPEEETIKKINEWLKGETERTPVLDLEVNPSLIGGARISFEGRWADYSLSANLEKENLEEVFKNV